MMKAALIADRQFRPQPECIPESESTPQKLHVKKPVPNKFKTEMCRNFIKEGTCRYGNECTYAHGEHELNKKPSVPQNLQIKFCKSFTQKPYI